MDLPADYLEQIRAVYPKRSGDHGWQVVRTLIPRAITAGHSWERIINGAKAYAVHCQRKGMVGTEFVKQARTFFGPDAWFDEWADMDTRTPEQIKQDARMADLSARAQKLGFRAMLPQETPEAYETQLRHAERDNAPRGQPKFAVIR